MRASVPTLACGFLCLLLTAWPGTLAFAQAEVKPFVNAYLPDYFAGAHPSSALEMVGLLPGFQLVEGDAKVRGYSGAIGNVLIDGRPPTSKQETLTVILQRISTDAVARVEIVRSGAAGFDFQGFPLLANIVIKPNTAPRGQVTLEDAFFRHGQSNPIGTIQFSLGSTYVLDLTATASRKGPDGGAGFGFRNNYNPNGTLRRAALYQIKRHDTVWNLTGGYRQPLFGGTVRLTGLYNEDRGLGDVLERQSYPTAAVIPGLDTQFKNNSEVGIQYNHALWAGAEIESAALRRSETDHVFQTGYNGTAKDVSVKHAHSSETILHNVLRQQGDSVSLESGLDATLNMLENFVELQKNDVNIPLPASNIHIVEQRGEVFSTLTWHAMPAVTIEPGMRYEMSRMKQTGDSVLTKQFGYLKPRLKASWKVDGQNLLRFLAEREAGQLNFQNFVTTVVVNSNTVNSGNKNLVPDTLWRLELAWERSFGGLSTVLTGRHEIISNLVDHVMIRAPSGDFDAIGNIGDARRDELQFSLVWPLAWEPLSGVTLQANGLYRFTEATDPNDGALRSISEGRAYEGKFSLTQDLSAWKMRWGATYMLTRGGNMYRFNEIQRMKMAQVSELFVEYKPSPQWLVRLFGKNVFDTPNNRVRYIYFGNRGTTVHNFTEVRQFGYGSAIGFNIQRTFGQ